MNPLFLDSHEPIELEFLLKPSVPTVRAPLNSQGHADLMWVDVESNTRQWERKQLGEALADLDAVEEQLNRELATCTELTLVVEGVGLPVLDGYQLYDLSMDRRYWRPGFAVRRKGVDKLYEAWKWGLRAAGVQVIETSCLELTARAVAGAYAASMKLEHTTLRRYVTPHIPPFDPDIHVDNLARLKDCGIGVERAQKLVKQLGTFYAVLTAPRAKLHSIIGMAVTKKLWETLGRVE